MLQLGQITALGTVVFTAVLVFRNAIAIVRMSWGPDSYPSALAKAKDAASKATADPANPDLKEKADATAEKAKNTKPTIKQCESSIATQVIVWVAGVLAVYVADWAGLSSAFSIGGKNLATLGVGAKIVLGLMASSTLSVVTQIKKALDNTDSARTSSLLGDPTLPPKPTTS
jgi:hypothetical protein